MENDDEVKRTYYREDLLVIPKDTNLKQATSTDRKEEEDFSPRKKRDVKPPSRYGF
jgi:hypothetical protein